ncbi:ABC transporter substrate-binding protein [Celeribacter sp. ULVN23_4]
MRHFLRLLFSLCALSALSGPLKAETIALSGPPIWESTPLIDMAETQPLADQGITFTFAPWKTPETLRKSLMSETPQLAVAPSLMAALFDARGIPLHPLSATASGGSLWLLGQGNEITDPAMLANQRIALPFKGNLPDLLMQRITRDQAAFTPVYTGDYMAAMQLLLAGKADLALLPEPLASALLSRAPEMQRRADLCVLWQQATTLTHCPPAGLVAANGALDAETLAKVQSAYVAAFARVSNDPSRAGQYLSDSFPQVPANDGAAYAGLRPVSLPLPQEAAPLAAFYAEIFALAPDALGGQLPAEDFFAGSVK